MKLNIKKNAINNKKIGFSNAGFVVFFLKKVLEALSPAKDIEVYNPIFLRDV
tara:strand:+ start:1541 stop:1696 length:156 start_codon:yes stop_codon:yes gene_type:complete